MRADFKMRLLAGACVLACSALAQKQAPPPGGAPKDFVLSETKTITLDNGLRATFVPYGAIPKVSVRVIVRAGNANEAENDVWLADLTADLMKEGTRSRTSNQIAEQAAGMGGGLFINVGPDQTTVGSDALSEFGPDVVGLLADVAQNPLFPESEIDRLKRDMLRNLSIERSQPDPLAQEEFVKRLYPGHPYGRLFPSPEAVQSFTTGKVRAFYEANLGAARSHVYVAGRFDAAAMEKAIRASFGGWARGPEPLIAPPTPAEVKGVVVVDRPAAPQSAIYIGLPVIDPSHKDFVALLATNALLGGSFSSRITTNIREDKGYTYSPSSQITRRYRAAYWAEVADVGTEVTGAALREILFEIKRLRTEAPSKEELEGIQNYMAGVFVLQNSSRDGIIGQLAYVNLHGLDNSYLTNFVKNVHALTPEDIRQTANRYLDEKNMLIVVAGNKKRIKEQVSGFGPWLE
jgi:zinc protease